MELPGVPPGRDPVEICGARLYCLSLRFILGSLCRVVLVIVVKIELHSARTGCVELLGTTIISNAGGSHTRGDYDVRVGHKKDAGAHEDVYKRPLRTGSVKNYPRLSYNVWRLVIRALKSAFPEEK